MSGARVKASELYTGTGERRLWKLEDAIAHGYAWANWIPDDQWDAAVEASVTSISCEIVGTSGKLIAFGSVLVFGTARPLTLADSPCVGVLVYRHAEAQWYRVEARGLSLVTGIKGRPLTRVSKKPSKKTSKRK